MGRKILSAGMLLGIAVSVSAGAPGADNSMFQRMQGLVGEWEGTYEWSEGRTGSGDIKVTYYLTGVKSALVENWVQGGVASMSSIYHLDGDDLRMTHYCGARTQPRLKASRIDASAGVAEFSFVDVTNAKGPKAAYVEGVTIHMIDADHLNLKLTFRGPPGASGVENLALKRVPATGAQS